MAKAKTRVLKTSKSRRNPAQSRSEFMVASILEAAARVLESSGWSGFTTNAVALKAGVSVGSLYQYFPNKDALIIALILNFETALETEFLQVLHETKSTKLLKGVSALVDVLLKHHFHRIDLNRILEEKEAEFKSAEDIVTEDAARILPLIEFLKSHASELKVKSVDRAAVHLILIARTLADSAVASRQEFSPELNSDIIRAIMGYLTYS